MRRRVLYDRLGQRPQRRHWARTGFELHTVGAKTHFPAPDPDFGEVRQRFRHGILQRHQVEPGPGIVGRDEGLDLVSRPSGEPAIDEPAGMGAPGREVVGERRSSIRKKVGPLAGVSHAAQYGVNQAARPFSRELAGVIHRLRHRRVRRYRSHVEDLIGPETQHLEHLCVERLEAAMHT